MRQLFLCLSLEVLLIHLLVGLDSPVIIGGDGPGYHRLALNLLDRSGFSLAESPPYEPTLIRTPGYPFFMALIYFIGGRSFILLRVVQFAILGVTAWFLYQLASRFVSRRAAVIASIVCVTYPPFVFLSLYHLTETLATFLGVLFVFSLVCSLDNVGKKRLLAFFIGFAAGIITLVRPSMSLLVIFPAGAIILRMKTDVWRTRILVLSCVLVGFMLPLTPWVIRNYMVAHKFVPLGTVVGAWALFLSAQQYEGEISYRVTIPEFDKLKAEYFARWEKAKQMTLDAGSITSQGKDSSPQVQQELIVDHGYTSEALQRFRRLTWRQIILNLPLRLAYLWGTCDLAPWPSGRFHRVVQAHYAGLVALIALGIWLCRKTIWSHWPVWIIPVYLTLLHLVFFSEPRHSLPARPFLFIYAGVALDQLACLIRRVRQADQKSRSVN